VIVLDTHVWVWWVHGDERLAADQLVHLDAGHRLRVYVPYGTDWYRYSLRRLRENPSIAGHVLRAFFRRG